MKTERQHILFVMGRLGDNGATRSLLALLKALPKDMYDISLFICLNDNKTLLEDVPSAIRIVPGILEYEINRQPLKLALCTAMRAKRFDLVWFRLKLAFSRFSNRDTYPCWDKLPAINGNWDVVISYADGWLSSMVIKKVVCGKKILWVHENYEEAPKSKEVLDSFAEADAIVGVSKDSILHLSKILGTSIAGKTHVVHNIIDPDEIKAASILESVSLPSATHNLISVGRVSFEKGYDTIPPILEKLYRQGIDVHWTVVGDGLASYRNKIIEDAKQRSVDSRLHFVGAKTNPHQYTVKADCLVQLSRHEGWCMTVSEALALGKPVVVSDLPVFHEQVFEGKNGYFAHDVDSFAESIQRVLSSSIVPALHSPLPFTPERVKTEFDEVIKSLG